MHRGAAAPTQRSAARRRLRRATSTRYRATHRADDRLPAGPRRRRWRTASPAARFLPEGAALRVARRLRATTTAATRWPGPSARWACRTARATWPRCTSTTSPTCCATRSTRASSSCATPRRWRRASRASTRWPQALAAPPNLVDRTLQALTLRRRRAPPADAGAGVGALPRRGLRGLSHRAGDQGARTRASSPCSAAASSTPSCASWPSRACSTSSTSSRSTPASARCSRCSSTWQGQRSASRLVRTFVRATDGAVRYIDFGEPDVPFDDVGTPTWDGLPLDRYLSLLDMLNPMHRLWSDGRWNKLTVAHGCYWKKCSFCDVSLDYISRYDAATRRDAGRPHRGHRRGDRADRLPLRRRGGAAEVAEGAGRRAAAAPAGDLVVGQHPLREVLHARAVPAARRQRLHRHLRRAGGGLRPAARR